MNPFDMLTRLLAGGVLTLPICVCAQSLTTLHTFTNSPDGENPLAGLVLSGNTLFGAAEKGGGGAGMVFRINTDGTCFTNLHNFPSPGAGLTNIGGAYPSSQLILSDNMLYGLTIYGGTSGHGTVYALDTGGITFTNLHNFSATVSSTNSDGATPEGRPVLLGGTLYGVAFSGGAVGAGALFSVNTNGTGFTNLYSFSNNNPAPQGGVIYSSNMLYGETASGAPYSGTVFRISTNGTGFTNLYNFSTETSGGNSDGAVPLGDLAVSGNTLYGTASEGGSANDGTIFKVNTDGSGFVNLHNFKGADGISPGAGLFVTNNVLFGTTSSGGSTGNGTVYQFNLSNSNLVTLHNFTAELGSHETNYDGAAPGFGDDLVLGSNTLYGTAGYGGLAGDGTVVAVTLPPPSLAITHSGLNVILTWPAYIGGFTLQSTTNLLSTSAWNNVSPSPVIVNMLNTVTNPATGSQMFFRLSQ